MQAEASFSCPDLVCEDRCYVEHCSFPWKVRDFLAESKRSLNYLGTILFSAGGNDKTIALWQLDLKMPGPQNEILIDLKRTNSQSRVLAFIRFHWYVVDVEGNKVFPGSIHAFAHPGDSYRKVFVPDSNILVKERFYPDGCLTVLCELAVYGRTLEDKISSTIRSEVPYELCVLSEDVEKLFIHESNPDLWIYSKDGVMRGHKSILIARSRLFADLLKDKRPEDCDLDLCEMKSDTLHAILTFLYCGNIDLYLKYAIPRDLYTEAEKFGLSDLQDHLQAIDAYDLTEVRGIEVTWKLPHFSVLLLQPKVELYCPERNSNTLYDDRWCFKLEIDSSGASMWVIRKQDEESKDYVQLIVRLISGESHFRKYTFMWFLEDGIQGIKEFISKDQLKRFISFQDTLELRCTLNILRREPLSEEHQDSEDCDNLLSAIALFSQTTENSLIQLSNDLMELFYRGKFKDTVVKTTAFEIDYHSYIADARFQISQDNMRVLLENIKPSLVEPLFLFIYGAQLSSRNSSRLKRYAEHFSLQNIVSKLSDFSAILPADLYESGSGSEDDDIIDAEDAMVVSGLGTDEEDNGDIVAEHAMMVAGRSTDEEDNGDIVAEHAMMVAGVSTDEEDNGNIVAEHAMMVAGLDTDENGNLG